MMSIALAEFARRTRKIALDSKRPCSFARARKSPTSPRSRGED
jgi:hypothetical protein